MSVDAKGLLFYFIHLFLERGEGREKEGEKPDQGLNPQPRHVL